MIDAGMCNEFREYATKHMGISSMQLHYWDKLQENSTPEKRNACGKPGLNGGYFNNPDLRFGVTCYGIKPEPRAHERVKNKLITDADADLQRMIDKFRKEMNNITILPFNRDKWGGCNA